jgi:hypothetical protein
MLIDLIRMPPVFGIPTLRQFTLTTQPNINGNPSNTLVWYSLPLYHDQLEVGAPVDSTPKQLYKAIHLSDDEKHVFETVFSMENGDAVCLYTRIINSGGVHIGISLNAIKYYQSHPRNIFPISHFLISNQLPGVDSVVTSPLILSNPMQNIVPPILETKLLSKALSAYMDVGTQVIDMRLAYGYYPLYQQAPGILNALLDGRFDKSPFKEMPGYHPSFQIKSDRWFKCEQLKFANEARGAEIHINHQAFDEPVLALMNLFPTSIEIVTLMGHALDRLDFRILGVVKAYDDPYDLVTKHSINDHYETVTDILYNCVVAYCRLYQINYEVFMGTQSDRSSITVARNIYDEIEITIHDVHHGRYVSFYSSFPALALSTLSVGWYR